MSREQIEIKVVTYKEERLNYFTALYEKAKNKFDRLFKKHKDAPYLSDEFQKLSDAGHEAEFLGDVVKMLKQSEWISVDERFPEPDGIIRKWGELRIQPSVRVLCACKQKGGKVFVKEGYCELWGSRVVWRIPGNIDVVTHWMPLPEPPKEKYLN